MGFWVSWAALRGKSSGVVYTLAFDPVYLRFLYVPYSFCDLHVDGCIVYWYVLVQQLSQPFYRMTLSVSAKRA